jgi:hypothetical protein
VTRRGAWLLTATAGVLALGLAGCATVPDSSPVYSASNVAAGGGGTPGPNVWIFPKPPHPGELPAAIVEGFLEAMASDGEPNFATAREYLSTHAQRAWDPSAGTVIVSNGARPSQSGSTVTFAGEQIGSLDASGYYKTPQSGSERYTATFRLVQEQGNWRIDTLPDGLILRQLDFNRIYADTTPTSLYFVAAGPTGASLVPCQVYLRNVTGAGLLQPLTERLIENNCPTLANTGIGQSLLPADANQAADLSSLAQQVTVSTNGSAADVNLPKDLASASAPALRAFAIELYWTLNQAASITSVQLVGPHGQQLTRAAQQDSDVQALSRLVPAPQQATPAYVLRDGLIAQVLPSAPGAPTTEPFGSGLLRPGRSASTQPPTAPPTKQPPRTTQGAGRSSRSGRNGTTEPTGFGQLAVQPGSDMFAAVSADGTKLYVGPKDDTTPRVWATSGAFSSPTWDAFGDLYVLSVPAGMQPADGTELLEFPGAASASGPVAPVTVDTDATPTEPLSIRVAGDGVRMAMVYRDPDGVNALTMVVLQRTGHTVTAVVKQALAQQLHDVTAVAWTSNRSLAVLGANGADPSASRVILQFYDDGSLINAPSVTMPATSSKSFAASGGQPLLTTVQGRGGQPAVDLYSSELNWTFLADNATDPVYPG